MKPVVVLFVTLLVVQLSSTSTSVKRTTCKTRSQCGSGECCYHSNLAIIARKRQLLPFDLTTGTCQKLAKVGQSCDFLHGCGCEAGSVCRPDNMNYLLGGVDVKRRLLPGYTAHCHRDMSV